MIGLIDTDTWLGLAAVVIPLVVIAIAAATPVRPRKRRQRWADRHPFDDHGRQRIGMD